MNIIIPMAGMGKRMRPHTLTVPKPLIRLAGKSIVQRLVEEIVQVVGRKVKDIGFITGDFGEDVENNLMQIARDIGAVGHIYHQDVPLGTAHAVACAAELLEGPVTLAFADTLFKAGVKPIDNKEDTIWVSRVDDPSSFGVVLSDAQGIIKGFVEKPKEIVSDLAIIGIYSFTDGDLLRQAIQFLLTNNIQKSGEFQLTDALQHMLDHGRRFHTAMVDEWLDCGNKNATVHTNQRILEHAKNEALISNEATINDSIIRPPCFIGKGVQISNSIIGPHVSIEHNTRVDHSIITNSIIQRETNISNANIDNSMIGSFVEFKGNVHDVSIGDYTSLA